MNVVSDTVRILHVDDEPDLADLAATFLEREDARFSVDTAVNVTEGLAYLEENEVDCIISDYDMPGQNGIEFLEAVRETHPELPFILYTGKGSEEIASEAISAGVTDYLQKEGGTDQYTILANRIANTVEQFRSRNEVQRSEKRLRDVIDAVPEVLFVIDEDGTYLLANETLAAFHGTTVPELEEKQIDEVLRKPAVERILNEITTVLESGEPIQVPDIELTDATGTTHILEPRLRPFDFPETETRAVLGVSIDVTDQKRQLKELERYRAITQAATNTIITIDESNTIQSVNPAVEETFGYEPAEIVGEDLTVLMGEDAAEQHRVAFDRYLETGDKTLNWTATEFHGQHRDGSTIPLSVSLGEAEFEGDRFFVGLIRDISERMQMEQQLRTERDLLTGIVETSPVGIAVVGADGTISFAIDRAETIYGRSSEEISGFAHDDSRLDLVDEHGDPFEDGETPFERVVAGTERISDEVVGFRQPSGERVWVSVKGAAQRTDDGELERAVFAFEDVTEQRQLETELTEILGRVTDAFFALDEDFRFTHVNERAAELLQASADELLGETLWEMYPEAASVDEIWDAFNAAMETQEPQSYEAYYEPLEFWVGATVYPSENGVSVYFQDVTDRKEREQRLQETTSWLEAMFDQSPDMINIHDSDGNITNPNPRFCEKTGYDESELTGMKVWEIDQAIAPDEAENLWMGMDRGDRKRLEGVYQRKDGSTFPVEVHVRRFDFGGEDRFLVISRDISERKAREQTLQQERDRFRAVFEESFDAMVIADDDGQYFDANESATELFGLSKDELLGRSISEFAPRDFDFETAWKAFQRSENQRGTFPLIRADGTELRVEYAATMNITPGQHLSVLRDVTEREMREGELERHNERLEEFTSIVSHDLRNPLNVAQGRLELASEECDSDHLDAIGQAHNRMDALITDLLTLAREGDAATDITTVDLAAIADQCWQNVETKNATLVIDVEGTIRADESRLAQLFENLIRNADEHGGDTVTVSVGELDDGFYVEDDGPGIPTDERGDVFDAGYSTSTSGIGFGLSIVKQIVEAHDWSISVTEGSDGGARFEITGIQFVAT